MSYSLEGKDIVISGFEEGIADSPYMGIGDMRNINLTTMPGEAPVNFKSDPMILPPVVNAAVFSGVASTDTIVWTAGSNVLYPGAAIILNTNNAGGITTGVVYYVGNIVGNSFQLFENPFFAAFNVSPIDIISDGSGTFTTFQLGKPLHSCTDQGQILDSVQGIPQAASYMIDSKNQVWLLISYTITLATPYTRGSIIYLGNTGSTVTGGDSTICVWNNYLFLFRNGATDIWNMNIQDPPSTTWTYSWSAFTPSGTSYLRCLAAQDDAIYLCNGNAVASILEVAGTSFDPSIPSTYTVNGQALLLPEGEVATCLAELGRTLLVGGVRTYVYPWDRVSTSYNYPIVVAERYISLIVSSNSNAYIFAGNRGRIYITNGSNVEQYKKVPDYVSGAIQPYYITGGSSNVNASPSSSFTPSGDAIYWRDEVYFSMIAYDSSASSTLLTTIVGVWAMNLKTGALRLVQKMSYDTYSGTIPVICPDLQSFRPGGEGLFYGWIDADGNVGIDNGSRQPYTDFESIIETDMIPVGTFLEPFTPSQIEWKTSQPLGGNGTPETIRIYYRKNISDSWSLIDSTTYSTAPTESQQNVSAQYTANFEKAQWVQLRVEMASNSTTPTYCRLTEVRIRDYPSQ